MDLNEAKKMIRTDQGFSEFLGAAKIVLERLEFMETQYDALTEKLLDRDLENIRLASKLPKEIT